MNLQPYPGLRPFKRDESAIFFGRENQIDELLDKLQKHHFLAVVGTSGCGKSSLVRTGLLSAIESGFMSEAGSRWIIADARPENDPFKKLSEALLDNQAFFDAYCETGGEYSNSSVTNMLPFLLATLKRGPLSIHEILDDLTSLKNTNLLLLIDQFEEIFRYKQVDPAIATDFVNLLLHACEHPRVFVIITMRSDFLGNASRYNGLPEAINTGIYLTPRLERDELADAIALPARLAGGKVESDLVHYLLNEAGEDSDMLPLLQHTLMRLWDKDVDKTITLDEYKAFGGLKQALNDHAEEIFSQLDKKHQEVAERVFRILTLTQNSNKRDIRNPATLDTLVKITGDSEESILFVINVFRKSGDNFLVPPSQVEIKGTTVIDISHESLIRQWERLRRWVESEAESVKQYRWLSEGAERYVVSGTYLSGIELDQALAWKDRVKPTKAWADRQNTNYQEVMEYLDVSAQNRAKKQLRKALSFGSIAFTIIGIVFIGFIWKSSVDNNFREYYNTSLNFASMLSTSENYKTANSILPKFDQNLQQISKKERLPHGVFKNQLSIFGQMPAFEFQTTDKRLLSVEVSPDNRWLVTGDDDGNLLIYDLDGKKDLILLEKAHDQIIYDIAFDPSGKWFVTAAKDGFIKFWSRPSALDGKPQLLKEWYTKSLLGEALRALAIDPKGKKLAIASNHNLKKAGYVLLRSEYAEYRKTGKGLTLWNIENIMDPITNEFGYPEFMYSIDTYGSISEGGLTFSPNSKMMAYITHEGALTNIEFQKDDRLPKKTINNGKLFVEQMSLALAFSLDNKHLAVSDDNDIRTLDIKTNQWLSSYKGHKGKVTSIKFVQSPDFKQPLLVSASYDKTLRIWDSFSGVSLQVLEGHESRVSFARMAYDDLRNKIYSVDLNGKFFEWNLRFPRQKLISTGSSLPTAVTLSPDRKYLLAGFKSGAMQIYDFEKGQALLSGGCDVIKKVNVKYCDSLNSWPFYRVGTESRILKLLYSPDRQKFAIASRVRKKDENKINRFKLTFLKIHDEDKGDKQLLHKGIPTGDIISEIKHEKQNVISFSISKDWQYAASVVSNKILYVYKIDTGDIVYQSSKKALQTDAVLFDYHNHLVTSYAGEVSFWDYTDGILGQSPVATFKIDAAFEKSAFSPDGTMFAVIDGLANIRLIPLGMDGIPIMEKAVRLKGDMHTAGIYRAKFSPNSELLVTLGGNGILQVWNVNTGLPLFHIRLPTDYEQRFAFKEFELSCTVSGCYVIVPIVYKDKNEWDGIDKKKGAGIMVYNLNDVAKGN